MRIVLIAALGQRTRALGKDNKLLWRLPADMEHFKTMTTGHPVIMGRKTWESIPKKFRPLPQRTNIVVTTQREYCPGEAATALSLADALVGASIAPGNDTVYVIGGAQIYTQALSYADELELTLVDDDTPGDVFFPEYAHLFTKIKRESSVQQENGISYKFVTLRK